MTEYSAVIMASKSKFSYRLKLAIVGDECAVGAEVDFVFVEYFQRVLICDYRGDGPDADVIG